MRIITLLVALAVFSCTDIVEYSVPHASPQLGFNANLTPDSLVTAYVFLSAPMSEDVGLVSAAKVGVWENGVFVENLIETESGKYQGSFRPQTGKNYKIEVEADGYGILSAEQTIPSPVTISNARFLPNTGYDLVDERWTHTYEMNIEDPAETENFYEVLLYTEQFNPYDWAWYKDGDYDLENDGEWVLNSVMEPYDAFSNDTVWKAEGLSKYRTGSFFFSDKLFNGTSYRFTFEQRGNKIVEADDGVTYSRLITRSFVVLRSVSEHYYLTRRGWLLHLNNRGHNDIRFVSDLTTYSFMGQPVFMHNNILNGLGAMGAYSKSECEVDFSLLPDNYTEI